MLDLSTVLQEDPSRSSTSPHREGYRRRLSRPTVGRSLGAAVTAIDSPVRRAAGIISKAVTVSPAVEGVLLGCTRFGPGAEVESSATRVAWAIVGIALLHAHELGLDGTGRIEDALRWFSRDRQFVSAVLDCARPSQWRAAEAELANLAVDDDLWDLLPYVLEPHGHITRTRRETCDVSRATRSAKKSSGVFYTPSDVAEFLVKAAASNAEVVGTWLDPACGTGVFLRAVLDCARAQADSEQFSGLNFACTWLFGVDLSALSTDMTCIVLLADCAPLGGTNRAPIDAWRAIKANIVCGDALRIAPLKGPIQQHIALEGLASIATLFGSARAQGFDHVIMNPPYTAVTFGAEVGSSWSSFSAKSSSATADAQTAFAEMLWKFTRPGGSGAAILPLSIGTNTSAAYCALRRELAQVEGVKDFLFFDREPQAIFGEDIKTRNAILIFRRVQQKTSIVRTSRLLKWTAKQRDAIFGTDRLVHLNGLPVERFVPKVGSAVERDVYAHLCSLGELHTRAIGGLGFARSTISDLLGAPHQSRSRDVIVSATAYNFLNVFLASGLPKSADYQLSASPLNKLTATDSETAYAAMAILASRLSFWLWHVEGDGFHVTLEFLKRLPTWAVLADRPVRVKLAELGEGYWSAAEGLRVDSVNGGRQTSSFHTGYRHPFYREVDAVLLNALGLGLKASGFLDSFIEATVSVDGSRRDRGLFPF